MPPQMWWSEFEKRLTQAFNAYVKREQRIVHSDSMKIRMLVDKIKSDFLTPTKAQSEIELSRTPMTIAYNQSLAFFRNVVNQKHPPQAEAAILRARRHDINEVTSGRGGRGGRHARGGGRGGSRQIHRAYMLARQQSIVPHSTGTPLFSRLHFVTTGTLLLHLVVLLWDEAILLPHSPHIHNQHHHTKVWLW